MVGMVVGVGVMVVVVVRHHEIAQIVGCPWIHTLSSRGILFAWDELPRYVKAPG